MLQSVCSLLRFAWQSYYIGDIRIIRFRLIQPPHREEAIHVITISGVSFTTKEEKTVFYPIRQSRAALQGMLPRQPGTPDFSL